ncbi:Na+/H+ antiporter subunit D [Xylanibacillus composti]|uniref:Na+/H+ antiporter subunit D n=1 Tax=Xylanibacillus composti TaxID=1572762 RepID=A0A8J4H7C4_9BACL|nr:Na+/H+ antiporter subunit D [Xylanibacillus composti]GIQ70148.1 Na+/H+ antiporter subunit D [Xylanibacillus composti]
MNNVVVLPVLIPVLTGIALILVRSLAWLRAVGVVSLIVNTGVAAYLLSRIHSQGIQVLELGGWSAPFGIVLVADMLAGLLVVAANLTAVICLLFACRTIGEKRERFYFHSFYQFLIAGVCGSFLTGDIFNLFVFFEVMLISSYVLIVLGATKQQLRESIKYVLVNMLSSVFFVVSVGLLYGMVGTLNMADLSVRVAEMGQDGLMNIIALMFLFVFGLKAGLFLFFWLPGSYSAPPAAISAIFAALLTKVGIYALIRTFTLIFYHDPGFTHELLAWMAGATIVLGTIGAVGAKDVKGILVYNVVASVGFIILGLAAFTEGSLQGVVYYLMHDIVIKALLFLLGGAFLLAAGTGHLRSTGEWIKSYPLLGWMLFVTAFAVAGVPPLSGFVGKLLILEGGLRSGLYVLVGIGLLSSLLLLYSIIRWFMEGFWKIRPEGAPTGGEPRTVRALLLPCGLLLAVSAALGLGAEGLAGFVEQAAQTMADPSVYIAAVLGE